MSRGATRKGSVRRADSDAVPAVSKDRGAKQSKSSFSDKSTSYWGHHAASFRDSYLRLISTPVQTLMTSLVVAIALSLPTVLLLSLTNVQTLGQSWDAKPSISAYLNPRARDKAIQLLVARLEASPAIDNVDYISATQALEEFQALSGFGSVLSGLNENPLPASILIRPNSSQYSPAKLQSLQSLLQSETLIDDAVLDMDWVRKLFELMELAKTLVYSLAVLFSFGVLLIIGNTVRLSIENRKDEIVVSKLVGATNGFVRRPFLYTGALYGLFGGILASLIVGLGFSLMDNSVARLAGLYESSYSLRGLDALSCLKLFAVACGLGILGAQIAVGRHLSAVEPR